jgi:hypothetical protein
MPHLSGHARALRKSQRATPFAPSYARSTQHPRKSTNQATTYTYLQPAIPKPAYAHGAVIGRHGGSDLGRRRQRWYYSAPRAADPVAARKDALRGGGCDDHSVALMHQSAQQPR